jgi:GNAT superfamily N-acetyltransferase
MVELARPARDQDRTICGALLRDALTAAQAMRGGAVLVGSTTAEELLGRWFDGARSGGTAVLVGEFEQAVVGLAATSTYRRKGSTDLTGRIACCYVEEAARGVGVGTALMAAAVSWCAEQGCRDIDALALPGDRTSKQRLEAAGFTARLLTLNHRLG